MVKLFVLVPGLPLSSLGSVLVWGLNHILVSTAANVNTITRPIAVINWTLTVLNGLILGLYLKVATPHMCALTSTGMPLMTSLLPFLH